MSHEKASLVQRDSIFKVRRVHQEQLNWYNHYRDTV